MTREVESISVLFSREPDSWNEADMERMIAELRKRRTEWLEEEAKPKKTAKPKMETAAKAELKGLSGKELLMKLRIKS